MRTNQKLKAAMVLVDSTQATNRQLIEQNHQLLDELNRARDTAVRYEQELHRTEQGLAEADDTIAGLMADAEQSTP